MSQIYHSNARTNQHVREIIQNSDLTNVELAKNYNVNVKAAVKWKNRDSKECANRSIRTLSGTSYL